ncbi:MAG TPA: MaoC/PaaZ C-terminal domain-containing protein [Anaerolineae bacterium]|jgi:3-hydroxybutyryl-CoA dehydratase|nr:MaoC/PaaZ C-terminal domain-containing protein [Anaerolineae bacterium]
MTDYAPRGLYYEDMEVGFKVVTAGRTISEADIMAFAGLSGDWNAIHIDAEYAKTAGFGERVAHGLLVLSIASGLAMQMGFLDRTVEAFTALDWKFRAPTKIGDTIHLEAEVKEKKAVPGGMGGFVIFNMTIKNQRDEKVQRGTWMVVVKSKPKE